MSNSLIPEMRRGIGRGLAFVVTGPSGAGKNSVIDRVIDQLPGLAFSVSYTTRAKREGEVHGEDYLYVSREEFDSRVTQGDFAEHVTYLGDQYGTSRSQIERVLAAGDDVILQIEVQGAQALRASGIGKFKGVYVFLMPSSFARLGDRLRSRGTESEEEITARLRVAEQEVASLSCFDYLVINDHLKQAVDELRSIIAAERLRVCCSKTAA